MQLQSFSANCYACTLILYTQYKEILLGEDFTNFATCSLLAKIYHGDFLSCVKDCIEVLVTFTTLVKTFFHQILLQCKGS